MGLAYDLLVSPAATAVDDAERVRAAVWGDRFPVDPVRIARAFGMRVLFASLAPHVPGALVKERGHDPVIVLNEADSSSRKRFTCAHELGHFSESSDTPETYEYFDVRDSLAVASDTDPEEAYANAFAASLLMPARDVRRLHAKGLRELELALHFDVAREVMSRRLTDLGLA
jgi:Zn-dependent peptidase ImmA (M78 family)